MIHLNALKRYTTLAVMIMTMGNHASSEVIAPSIPYVAIPYVAINDVNFMVGAGYTEDFNGGPPPSLYVGIIDAAGGMTPIHFSAPYGRLTCIAINGLNQGIVGGYVISESNSEDGPAYAASISSSRVVNKISLPSENSLINSI